jgi:hypothetical protein
MKQHKWAKEIKAWADGAEIEHFEDEVWKTWKQNYSPSWSYINEYRIKPQPKNPRYLYVSDGVYGVQLWREKQYIDNPSQYNIGKIKLEADDEK